jgi:beta-glucosidase
MYVALPSYKESEGYDRPDLDLTEHQVALIKAVTAAQPRTVVVLNSGSAVAMSEWIDGAAAVLEAWMMGQAGGGAIADVLFGRVSPSGKLAETFPLRLADTPAFVNYPGENGEVHYGESIFIGYRYYDKTEKPVLFPFGYGLSYTTFEYSSPRISAAASKDTDGVTVSVDVTNTGVMAGKEVVQVYVSQREPRLARPPKELKGFAKVELEPGKTKTVTIPLDFRAFAYYDPAHGQWVTEDGEFDILIGASSADIRFTQTVTLESTIQLPSLLDRESTVREWLRDPKGKLVFQPVFDQMMEEAKRIFSIGEEAAGESNIELMGMLDMPLLSLLDFQEAHMEVSALEVVDGLLQQVHGPAR